MRHWIQSVVDRWKTTSPKVEEKPYDYTPSKDFYKSTRERTTAEKKRLEKWRKELKERTMSTNINTYGGRGFGAITGNLSGYTLTNNTINTTSLADSAITINGDPVNGGVSIDVPLKVNGRDVMKEIDEMRDSLLLLKRDVDMESKYPRLKELKDEYERALEKYKTFETIKESK